MLKRTSRFFLIGAVTSVLCLPALVLGQDAEKKQPQCKDQQECDLYNSILKDNNPKTKLDKLQQWVKRTRIRNSCRFAARCSSPLMRNGQAPQALAVAKQSLAADPKDFNALYYTMFLTQRPMERTSKPLFLRTARMPRRRSGHHRYATGGSGRGPMGQTAAGGGSAEPPNAGFHKDAAKGLGSRRSRISESAAVESEQQRSRL